MKPQVFIIFFSKMPVTVFPPLPD